ncbi:MAG: hypothetical protein GKR90_22105 [Pseudomonadales bacterium]|nr:hypothetical protein [Pseudomonadales bacterium]
MSIFFAGLLQLEGNTYADHIFLGEYQVPKAILPLASLSFAVFAFWLVSNRLNMLSYVIGTTTLTSTMVHDIFHLNPPVLHVFDKVNADPWSPFSGLTVFIFIWSVFLGNAIALIWEGAIQLGATLAEFDPGLLTIYFVAIVGVMVYGARSVIPPLQAILRTLHGVKLKVGWPRHVFAGVVILGTFVANESDQFFAMAEQDDELLGPAYANAIDAETLYMNGVEVNLFGIDAVERDQICHTREGEAYPCGRQATQALQELVQDTMVICFPLVSVNERRLLAVCEIDGQNSPTRPQEFLDGFRPQNLSRIMIEQGHALSIGIGSNLFAEEQRQAQTLRVGIWQGSFVPPRLWRSNN